MFFIELHIYNEKMKQCRDNKHISDNIQCSL
jgi:hypothetical protein